jgi:NitT/TauT family transport system ATP-binding protein
VTLPSPKVIASGVARSFAGRHGDLAALGPLDLEVAEGEFVALVGPSGCGKTTFLRIVGGLLNPTDGWVEIIPRRPARAPVAMVFQDYGIYPWKTVLANVRFGLDMAGVPRAAGNDRARQWLDRLGLADVALAHPPTLSGGMRQRVAIARALAVEPEILLLDEPFAALDAQLRRLLGEELLRLWESERRTVLLVTHSVEEAVVLADRVVVMSARPGRVLADFAVPFGRPRPPDVRTTVAFRALENEIWELLRVEVQRTLPLLAPGASSA